MGQTYFTFPSRPILEAYAHDNVVDVLQDHALLNDALPLGYKWRAPLYLS